MRPGDSLKKL
jgi:hypothetical protein